MNNDFRLSRGLCAAIAKMLRGSHDTLDAVFQSSGATGEPPPLSHVPKWKEWLFRAGQDPSVDSLAFLGNVMSMDVAPEELRAGLRQSGTGSLLFAHPALTLSACYAPTGRAGLLSSVPGGTGPSYGGQPKLQGLLANEDAGQRFVIGVPDVKKTNPSKIDLLRS